MIRVSHFVVLVFVCKIQGNEEAALARRDLAGSIYGFPEGRMASSDGSDCGSVLLNLKRGQSGVLTSPNYPKDYPPNARCTWWLQAEEGEQITVECDKVELQECPGKYYDFVLISPDWGWNLNQTLVLCGNMSDEKPSIMSNSDKMAVHFRSSKINQFKGFSCRYKVESNYDYGHNGEEGCGQGADENRIVGGLRANPEEFPWMVGLAFNFSKAKSWFCGGTLVSRRHVLTAAHCTHPAVESRIYMGTNNLNKAQVLKYSTRFFEHPGYNHDKIENDVSLIELDEDIEFSDSIRPICLPTFASQDYNLAGHSLLTAGWGKTSNEKDSKIGPELNKLNVSIVPNEYCELTYGNLIKETNICADSVEGQGTCRGDSGSVLQWRQPASTGVWIQEGIVSFGPSTGCASGYPNGYSRIAHYLHFIQDITGIKMN